MLSSVKTKLLPHQVQTVKFGLEKKYFFDLSVPGTGKSLSALALIASVGKKAVVICPAHLVNNWINEISKHTTLKASPHFLKFNPENDVFVIPYTKLSKAEETIKNVDMVFADECHFLKSLDSQRTQHAHYLLNKYPPEYLILMTGTVLKNRVTEIYSPLLLLGLGKNVEPKIVNTYKSFYTFACRFTNLRQTPYGAQFSGSKNVEELRKYLLPFAIKHKEDVLSLPELSESNVVVNYNDDPDLMRAFEEFQDKSVGSNIVAKTRSAEAKAPFTANYVMSLIDQDCGPIVVFSDHRKSISLMELEFSKKRVRSITGETSMDKRTDYVNMLNNGQLDVLICSIGSSSSGITLTGASTLVFNDVPFVPGDLDQAKKRIHRLSQTKPCRIVYIVGSTVDERIIKMLNDKTRTINKVLN